MLAQNFKSAADLGISEKEHTALIQVLGMLERGELVDVPVGHPFVIPNGFNMDWTFEHGSCGSACGTVGCIGGWVGHLMGESDPDDYVDSVRSSYNNKSISALYWNYPSEVGVKHAAAAVRNYLTVGEPRWEEVLQSV